MPKSRHPKHKPKSTSPSPSLLLNIPKELQRIDDLIASDDFEKAAESLKELAERAPHRADVFETMLVLGTRMHDADMCLDAVSRLVKINPFAATNHYNLFVIYLQNGFPALALKVGTDFLKRWPNHKHGIELPKVLEELRQRLLTEHIVAHFPEERRIEILALHDGALLGTARANYEQAIESASQLIRLEPSFIPAYNNRAFAYWAFGDTAMALADTERALTLDAENVHALFAKVRYAVLSNRIAEAHTAAERLRAIRTNDPELLIKQAEAFSYLRDDGAVLEVVSRLESQEGNPLVIATLHLFAGVAAARLGEITQARFFLNEARKYAATAKRAEEQLADLDRPEGQRENSHAFLLDHWIPRRVVDEFAKILGTQARRANVHATTTALQKFLAAHPHLVTLLPMLLEHGDDLTRRVAFQMAELTNTPELWQALKDFAASPHGTDRFRNEVLLALQEAGQYEKGQRVSFWSAGKPTFVIIHRYTVDNVPYEANFSEHVSRISLAAMLAHQQNDWEHAETILTQALHEEPNSAKLQFQLVLTYLKQGRVGHARELAEKITAQHPQYALSRITLTKIAIANNRNEEAEQHLKILTEFEHFHYSEYAQFCQVQLIYCLLVKSDHDGAQQWFALWEKRSSESPELKAAQQVLKNRATSKQWARQMLAPFRES